MRESAPQVFAASLAALRCRVDVYVRAEARSTQACAKVSFWVCAGGTLTSRRATKPLPAATTRCPKAESRAQVPSFRVHSAAAGKEKGVSGESGGTPFFGPRQR